MTESQAETSRARPHARRGGVSIATRLAAAVLVVSLVALVVATMVGVRSGFELGRDIYAARLTSDRESGAFDVAAELQSTRAATQSVAVSPAAADAVARFSDAFDTLSDTVDLTGASAGADLVAAYEDTYLASTGPDGAPLPIGDIVAADPAAIYLQSRYSLETVDVDTGRVVTGTPTDGQNVETRIVADPGRLDDAGDGSEWSTVHALYHPTYRRAVEQLGLLDLYLVEPIDARVVYSVEKGPDVGTSLVTGPYGGTVLANTVKQVIDDPAGGTVVSDLAFYPAAPGHTVGIMATPIMRGAELTGVVASMYDGALFDEMLTADRAAADDTEQLSDVYLISADGTLRSNPKGFLDNPQAFLDASEASGLLSSAERDEIDRTDTTVLTQPAVGATAQAGEAGDESVRRGVSMTGMDVFTTVGPVPFDSVDWYVASEATTDAAEATFGSFRDILIVGASLFVIAIAFFAVGWANRIMRPVRTISERLGAVDQFEQSLTIPEQSPVEMHHLVASFDSMSATLDAQRRALALAREDRLGMLRRMLPAAIAERLAADEVDALEQVPQATVVVIVIRGLGQSLTGRRTADRDVVDRLHAELDVLAEQHGLDRIKIVGDAYFAACGHDRPFIDHAPRVVTFATDARDAIRSLGSAAHRDLDVAVGIDTGPVNVGMTGGMKLVYDVWGEAVGIADHLARSAPPGVVLISDATHALLPDEVPSTSTELAGATVWTVAESAMGGMG